jgi:TPR repeat protein
VALVLTLVLMLVCGQHRTLAENKAKAWKDVQKSLVVIGYVTDENNASSFVSYGSGFCIKSGDSGSQSQFITDNHVTADAGAQEKLVVLVPHEAPVPPTMVPATVVSTSTTLDLSIVSAKIAETVPALQFSSSLPDEAQEIAVGGFPYIQGVRFGGVFGKAQLMSGETADLEPDVHLGAVSKLHLNGGLGLVAFDLYGGSVDHGNSGGPLFDPDTGVVYGVVDGFLTGSPADDQTAGTQASTAVSNLALVNAAAIAFINGQKWGSPSGTAANQQNTGSIQGMTKTSARAGPSAADGSALQDAAQSGFAPAQNALGLMYQYGSGVPIDYGKAVHYFQLAANAGYPDAESNLGIMYYYGLGVAVDRKLAFNCFEQAAIGGKNASALVNLGRAYEFGNGVDPDYAKALAYFKDAADLGSSDGYYNLGWMYFRGLGVSQDYAVARVQFLNAARAGNGAAENKLGVMSELGLGVPVNFDEALAYYKKAGELHGYDEAQYHLAYMYEYGEHVEKNLKIASGYYSLAMPALSPDSLDQASPSDYAPLAATPGVANARPGWLRVTSAGAVPGPGTMPGNMPPSRLRWSDAINPCCLGIHSLAPSTVDPNQWVESFPSGQLHFHRTGRTVVNGNAGTVLLGDELRGPPGDAVPIWLFIPDLNAHGDLPNWIQFTEGAHPGTWIFMQEILEES